MRMEWPIDPQNPGEIFACAGIARLMWITNPECKTGFVVGDQVRFVAPDISVWIDRLADADLEITVDGDGLLFAGLNLDWWQEWGLNSGLKTWAGQQTEFTVHDSLLTAAKGSKFSDWLTYTAPAKGRFNFDIPGTWNALNLGWSVNEHSVKMSCRPWVELLSSIGLQAFPVEEIKGHGFKYSIWRQTSFSGAVTAFSGYGPTVYSLRRYYTKTAMAGSNTMLTVAKLDT